LNRLRGAIAAAAAVAIVAGCGGGNDSEAKPYQEPKGAAAETVKIEAGNFYFKPDAITTNAGIVQLELDDAQGTHTLVFDNDKAPGFLLEVSNSDAHDAKKIELTRGKYTFYCNILGHRAQGMEGTITVK